MEKQATIRVVCKQWSEWSTDERGEAIHLEHDFEGVEKDYYNVYNEEMEVIADDIETFEEAQEIANNYTN